MDFWLDNYTILYEDNKVFPIRGMHLVEKLNAMMRLAFLVGAFLIISTGDFRYIVIPAVVAIATIYIYKYRFEDASAYFEAYQNKEASSKQLGHKKKDDGSEADGAEAQAQELIEKFEEVAPAETAPTENNPLMNMLPMDARDKPPAMLNINNEELDAIITKNFAKNLYQDTGDVFNKESSQRQYYTTPNTTAPNAQTAFAKWAYQAPPTCKEEGIKCAPLWEPS